MKSVPYLNAVGALQYLATMTRPDIAYAVSYLGRFNCNPAPAHWLALLDLLPPPSSFGSLSGLG
jgi:hypothetical protein